MLLDVRTYTCRPGTIKAHLALYAKMGKEPAGIGADVEQHGRLR